MKKNEVLKEKDLKIGRKQEKSILQIKSLTPELVFVWVLSSQSDLVYYYQQGGAYIYIYIYIHTHHDSTI